MSVTEYKREFTWLSKYAPEMLVTKGEKCRKFEDGLNDHIRAYVTGFSHDQFSKIMTCALNVERVKKECIKRKKEDKVRKTLDSQVLIITRVRNSEDHKVLINLQLKDQLRLQVVRLLYQYH